MLQKNYFCFHFGKTQAFTERERKLEKKNTKTQCMHKSSINPLGYSEYFNVLVEMQMYV